MNFDILYYGIAFAAVTFVLVIAIHWHYELSEARRGR